jgi:hypothetical protein
MLKNGLIDTVISPAGDGSLLVGSGPFDLAAGDSLRVAFAILGSDLDLEVLKTEADRAAYKYANPGLCTALPGDVNSSGGITLGDVVHILNFLFDRDRPPCKGIDPGNCWAVIPSCLPDVNASGNITLADVIHLLNYLFDRDKPPCIGIEPGNCWTPLSQAECCLPFP